MIEAASLIGSLTGIAEIAKESFGQDNNDQNGGSPVPRSGG